MRPVELTVMVAEVVTAPLAAPVNKFNVIDDVAEGTPDTWAKVILKEPPWAMLEVAKLTSGGKR